MPSLRKNGMYQTKEGLWVRDKGEEGVREQQKEYKGLISFFEGKECQNIWDLGAHVGWFTWYSAKHLHPKNILCVECSPKQLEMLKKNIPANGQILEGAIVSDSYKGSTIGLYLGKQYTSCDCIQEVRGRESISVPVVRMVDIVRKMPNPQVIKIDIEGAEYEIDWKKWMPKSVEIVVAELHHQREGHLQKMFQMHETLLSLGFTANKQAKESSYNRTCHVEYVRKK